MSNSAIECVSVRREFGEVAAVNGVDLDIANGEIYGFLGPNGAGKSTTVRMLCTLLAPTSGRASVAGFDVVQQPNAVRLRIGVALQEAALDPRQTGAELAERLEVSDVQEFPWGRFVFLADPDGNAWALQQIPPR